MIGETEYLAPKISVKLVDNVEEVVLHKTNTETMYTDSIVTENKNTAKYFLKVNSSILVYNVRHIIADGSEFGFGGEIEYQLINYHHGALLVSIN